MAALHAQDAHGSGGNTSRRRFPLLCPIVVSRTNQHLASPNNRSPAALVPSRRIAEDLRVRGTTSYHAQASTSLIAPPLTGHPPCPYDRVCSAVSAAAIGRSSSSPPRSRSACPGCQDIQVQTPTQAAPYRVSTALTTYLAHTHARTPWRTLLDGRLHCRLRAHARPTRARTPSPIAPPRMRMHSRPACPIVPICSDPACPVCPTLANVRSDPRDPPDLSVAREQSSARRLPRRGRAASPSRSTAAPREVSESFTTPGAAQTSRSCRPRGLRPAQAARWRQGGRRPDPA